MRVLLLSDFYRPYVGGVEQHVRSLAHALVTRGHDVAVATLRTASAPTPFEHDGPVRVHRVRGAYQRIAGIFATADRPWAPPLPDPALALALRRVIALERPDVVHGHDWFARSAAPACRQAGVPFVTTLHYYTRVCAKKTLVRDGQACAGPAPLACLKCAGAHYGLVKGAVTVVGNWVGRAIEDRIAGETIAVSAATAAGNRLASPGRWRTIPNMLPDTVPGSVEGPDSSEAPLPPGLPAAPFLLYVGDLRSEKGVPTLLEAYRLLNDPPPLVLVGESFPSSPRWFPPGVIVTGPVSHDRIAPLWRRASMAIVPSVWEEPFGIVALEAMAAGRPVVASRVGGLAEVVDDGVTGVLVTPADPAALAAGIQRLLDDAELRSRLGAAARVAAERYRSAVVVEAVERCYLDAIRRTTRVVPQPNQ